MTARNTTNKHTNEILLVRKQIHPASIVDWENVCVIR